MARLSTSQKEQARKAPSPGGRPSTVAVGCVAEHEAILGQASLNSLHRPNDAGVVRWEKPDQGRHEQRSVKFRGTVGLYEAVRLVSKPFSQTSRCTWYRANASHNANQVELFVRMVAQRHEARRRHFRTSFRGSAAPSAGARPKSTPPLLNDCSRTYLSEH